MMIEMCGIKKWVSVLGRFFLLSALMQVPVTAVSVDDVSWYWAGAGIPELTVEDLSPGTLTPRCFAVTTQAVYLTQDGGLTWTRLFRLPQVRTKTPQDRDERREIVDDRPTVERDDLDELKRLGIIDDWIEDLDEIDEDIDTLIEDAGYRVAEETPEDDFEAATPEVPEPEIAPRRPNRIFWQEPSKTLVVVAESGSFISNNDGATWREIQLGLSEEFNTATAVSGSSFRLIISTQAGLFQSTDQGQTWTAVSTALAMQNETFNSVTHIPGTSDSFFATTDDSGLVLEATGGSQITREVFTSSGRGQDTVLDSIAISSTALAVALGSSVSYSSDAGQSWSSLPSLGLPSGSIARIMTITDDLRGPIMVVAGANGIYYYNSDIQRWQSLNRGLRLQAIYSIKEQTHAPEQLWLASEEGIFHTILTERLGRELKPPTDLEADQWRNELAAVHSMTLRQAFIDHSELAEWYGGARKRYWLPEARLSLRFNDRSNTRIKYTNNINLDEFGVVVGPDDVTYSRSDRETFLIRFDLRWFPGSLLHNSSVIDVAKTTRTVAKFRHKLLTKATKLYGRRLALVQDEGAAQESVSRAVSRTLQLQEIDAQLNSLMGGIYFAAPTEPADSVGTLND